MPNNIQNVAIMTKVNSDEAYQTAKSVNRILQQKKINVFAILPLCDDKMTSVSINSVNDLDIDLILAIGGDGTTLKAFRTPPFHIPVLSINIGGHKGILSELRSSSIDYIIRSLLLGNHFYDSRMRIQASIEGVKTAPALNDILLTRTSLTRTPLLSVTILGEEIKERMDGIIISTPTGSTGHSFSIGSPVLHESLNSILLSPLASVNKLPFLILPLEDIKIKSSHDSMLVVDGQETHRISAGQNVIIFRFPIDARFLRMRKRGARQLEKLGFI
jgi:NAD+ kinase